jgi:mRNA interferase MazF
MAYIKGDVVLVPFPFTDLRARKVRPAVILSSTVYHATEPDLILGAITTNLKTAPVDYVLSDGCISINPCSYAASGREANANDSTD